MTKEELEKEAEENSFRFTLDKPWVCEVERNQIMAHFEKGYLAGAEPREKRIAELEKENAELKEVHESDKRSLALIAKKGADFEKAYNEAEKLLDKQIEATYKVVEENKELKKQQFTLRNERNTFLAQNEQYEEDLIDFNEKLTYAKTIIKDLLDNSDEYARQRAEDFLKENK